MRNRDARGFTLMEIVVSLAITAIIMSVVYGSLRSAGKSLQTLSVRNQLYRSTYALLDEMGRELSCAYLSRNAAPLNGKAKTYFWVEDKESHDMPQDDLFFTTLGHAFSVHGTGESDQSEVCYFARYSEKRDELILLKREDVTLDDVTCRDESPEDWQERSGEEPPTPVATGIHPERGAGYRLVGFQVEGYAALNDEESVVEWDSDNRRTLPSRLVVTLTYEDEDGNLYPFSKEVVFRLMGTNLNFQVPAGTGTGVVPRTGTGVPGPGTSRENLLKNLGLPKSPPGGG